MISDRTRKKFPEGPRGPIAVKEEDLEGLTKEERVSKMIKAAKKLGSYVQRRKR
jgi:hypothetical protein